MDRPTPSSCSPQQEQASGDTISERDAHRLFIELDEKKNPFTLMHCYVEFEKYPKWQTRPPPQKKHKKTSDASPGTTSNDEDFDVCTDALEEEIRPHGTKKDKKECLLKDSDCKLSLESVLSKLSFQRKNVF
ncbi:glutathione S-transferase T2-like [Hordeum vulgare]|nr:glutathione S-transferase T2-like [Hordeum vulgare]